MDHSQTKMLRIKLKETASRYNIIGDQVRAARLNHSTHGGYHSNPSSASWVSVSLNATEKNVLWQMATVPAWWLFVLIPVLLLVTGCAYALTLSQVEPLFLLTAPLVSSPQARTSPTPSTAFAMRSLKSVGSFFG
jgi:hypothetical protein